MKLITKTGTVYHCNLVDLKLGKMFIGGLNESDEYGFFFLYPGRKRLAFRWMKSLKPSVRRSGTFIEFWGNGRKIMRLRKDFAPETGMRILLARPNGAVRISTKIVEIIE